MTAPGALLDGIAAPAPTISGSTLTFPTGSLSDGLHVLSGELEDASGTRSLFRVAVSIQNVPTSDPPPVERSITAGGDFTVTLPGGLVSVRMPRGRVADAARRRRTTSSCSASTPARPAPASYPGTQIVEVTARWALAGTFVTEFNAPIEINFVEPGRRSRDPRMVAGRHQRRHAMEQHGPPSGLDPSRHSSPMASTATRRQRTC